MFTFEEIKEKAVPIAIKHGVDSISLFGSYARNEQKEDSDLDFYIESGNITSYFKYIAFVNELEKVFGCHVDVISEGIEDKKFLKKIENDKVMLYVG